MCKGWSVGVGRMVEDGGAGEQESLDIHYTQEFIISLVLFSRKTKRSRTLVRE